MIFADADRSFGRLEPLEDRLLLSGVAYLPGLTGPADFARHAAGQVIYLDFAGAHDVAYDGPVHVTGINVSPFAAPSGADAQPLADQIAARTADALARFGVVVTMDQPIAGQYSTIYVGGTGESFQSFGNYLGLAEKVDVGNADPADNAFVFSAAIGSAGESDSQFVSGVSDVTIHEAWHLLGLAHEGGAEQVGLGAVAYSTGGAGFVGALGGANKKGFVHQYITYQAWQYYVSQFGPSEIDSYIGAVKNYSSGDNSKVTEGSYDEDVSSEDPFDNSDGHYWAPQHDFSRVFDHGYNGQDAAPNRGWKYFTGGYGLDGVFDDTWDNNGVAGQGLVWDYSHGDTGSAYYFLGHVAHLMEDVTLPAHALADPHGGDDWSNPWDDYEYYTQDGHNFERWSAATLAGQPIRSPAQILAADSYGYNATYDLFYENASTADNFDSDDKDGQVWQGDHRIDHWIGSDSISDADCRTIGDTMVPMAIKSVAELYRYFYSRVDATAPDVTVAALSSSQAAPTAVGASVAVAGGAVDTTSGVDLDNYHYTTWRWNGSDWTDQADRGASNGSQTLAFSTDGVYRIQLSAINGGGLTGVSSYKYVQVTGAASADPVARTAGLNVLAAGEVVAPNSAIDLGWLAGGTARSFTFTLADEGAAPISIVNVSAGAGFAVTQPATLSLNGGDSTTFTVSPGTGAAGPKTGQLTVTTGSGTFAFDLAAAVESPAGLTNAAGSLNWTEDSPAAAVSPATSVVQGDQQYLVAAQVNLAGYVAGQDVLSVGNLAGLATNFDATSGTLTLDGMATSSDYQAALRSVTYVNLSQDPSPAARTLSYVLDDGRIQSLAGTTDLSVTAVNDAPINHVPAGMQLTNLNTGLVFTGGRTISVSDVDAENGLLRISLAITHGTVTLGGTANLAFTTGDGTGDSATQFTGALADVNAALAGLTFTPDPGYVGSGTILVTTDDQGNTGSGGPLADSDTIIVGIGHVHAIDAHTPVPFVDGAGHLGDVSLTGPGAGYVFFASATQADIGRIELAGGGARSVLSITMHNGAITPVGDVAITGSFGTISAGAADLVGDVTVSGVLSRLTLRDATQGSAIDLGPRPAGDTRSTAAISLARVRDLAIHSDMPISSLGAVNWLNTGPVETIAAPSIGSLSIAGRRGNLKLGVPAIPGNLEADVDVDSIGTTTIAGDVTGAWQASRIGSMTVRGDMRGATIELTQAPGVRPTALGSLTVAGWIKDSSILSAGDIGSIGCGGLSGSIIFAGAVPVADVLGAGGVPDGVADLPAAVGGAGLGSVTITGAVRDAGGYSLVNSNIAASAIGKANLANAKQANGGVPFGLAAESIFKVSYKGPTKADRFTLSGLTSPADSAGFVDLTVRIV
ncbi:MAG: hypothetical protein PHU85_05655 [Phycisphaerae bacterium]|nr:hypothetical protein [Phycisphaerae bacterium]